MDLINGNLKKIYIKFLMASFGSALISSIYGLVDMAMVGQYHGPDGAAAMAVISPVWNLVYGFGLLIGIGGSVLYGVMRGTEGEGRRANGYFTASVIFGAVISVILTVVLLLWEEPLLYFFGADEKLLPLCKEYLALPKFTAPIYVFINIISAFLRNDSAPGLATKSVIAGGVFNVFGDYFFVFTLDMGIKGAGIATAMGAGFSMIIMLTHFFSKKNTLRFVRIHNLPRKFVKISVSGFSSFIIDVAMGVLTVLFNRQIMKYLDSNALAVYGVIVAVSTLVQCCAYGVGQAAQPIISQNYGAKKYDRIRKVLKYSAVTSAILGAIWAVVFMALPQTFVKLFMTPTGQVLSAAPHIVRIYALSFLLLPFNVYSTYHFQAIMKPGVSMAVSVCRGILISGAFILALPAVFGGDSIWWAMPITETLVAAYVIFSLARENKKEKIPM